MQRLEKKGIDKMLDSMGFTMQNREGKEVLLSDYITFKEKMDKGNSKGRGRGCHELKKLDWEMNDGSSAVRIDGEKRFNRGKKKLTQ